MSTYRERLLAHYERFNAAAREGRARDFAVELIRGYVEHYWTLEGLLYVNGAGGGPQGYGYIWKNGKVTVTKIGGEPCREVFSVRDLHAEAVDLIVGKPLQMTLWQRESS